MDKSSFEKEVLAKVQPNSLAIAYYQAVQNRQAAVEGLTIGARNDVLLLMAMAVYVRSRMDTSHYDNINKYGKLADHLADWWETTNQLLTKLNEVSLKIKDIGMFKGYAAYLAKH
jgi:hypothetical protein